MPVSVSLELEWVLRSRYGFSKDQVLWILSGLLSARELSFECEVAIELALSLYRKGTADYSDCLHVALAVLAGEEPLWTFDEAAARIEGARLLT